MKQTPVKAASAAVTSAAATNAVISQTLKQKSINILVVGDPGVGKTSLITTLISGVLPIDTSLPSVLQQVVVTPEDSPINNTSITITDTSSHPDDRTALLDTIAGSQGFLSSSSSLDLPNSTSKASSSSTPNVKQQPNITVNPSSTTTTTTTGSSNDVSVIIIVYSVDNPDSFRRVRTYWMEVISKRFHGPVIVVGNKIDIEQSLHTTASQNQPLSQRVDGSDDIAGHSLSTSVEASEHTEEMQQKAKQLVVDRAEDLQQRMKPLIKQFSQVVAGLECSAKLNVNVSEAFYFAQHAVAYPIQPLFDTQTQQLTPLFRLALTRVFRIYDKDHDGLLSDSELNDFQESCFGARLQPEELIGLKKVLQKESPSFVVTTSKLQEGTNKLSLGSLDPIETSSQQASINQNNISIQGITLHGFFHLHMLFIQRNRAESTWLVLRLFGYDDNLNLLIAPRLLSIGTTLARGQTMELSKRGLNFFVELFHQFDLDKDGALSPLELDELFKICPFPPWGLTSSNSYLGADTPQPSRSATPDIRESEEAEIPQVFINPNDDSLILNQITMQKKPVADGGNPKGKSPGRLLQGRKNEILDSKFDVSNTVLPNDRVLDFLGDFPNGIATNQHDYITLNGWLSQWAMMTNVQPNSTLLYLRYLGYSDPLQTALTVTPKKSFNVFQDEAINRSVVRGFVFGDKGVGKSSLLHALVSKKPKKPLGWNDLSAFKFEKNKLSPSKKRASYDLVRSATNRVRSIGRKTTKGSASSSSLTTSLATASSSSTEEGSQQPCYLTLTEVPSNSDECLEQLKETHFVDCDIAIMIFDATSPDSVRYLASLQKIIPPHVPCVYLGNKVDLLPSPESEDDAFAPKSILNASQLCASYSLPSPESVTLVFNNGSDSLSSSSEGQKRWQQSMNDLFDIIYSTAQHPDTAQPLSENQRQIATRNRMIRSATRISLVIGSILAGVVVFSFLYSKQSSGNRRNN